MKKPIPSLAGLPSLLALLLLVFIQYTASGQGQLRLYLDSLEVRQGETFSVDVRVLGFDGVLSGQVGISWDNTVLKLLSLDASTSGNTDLELNYGQFPDRVSFLLNPKSGQPLRLADESSIARFEFEAIGNVGTATDLVRASFPDIEFMNLSGVPFDAAVIPGYVLINRSSSTEDLPEGLITQTWLSPDELLIQTASLGHLVAELYSVDGKLLRQYRSTGMSPSIRVSLSSEISEALFVLRIGSNGKWKSQMLSRPKG